MEDKTNDSPAVEYWAQSDGSERCVEPFLWFEQEIDDVEPGGILPMKVEVFRPWTDDELVSVAADLVADCLPEWMYENEEVTHWEFSETGDWPSLLDEEKKSIADAIRPWIQRCRASSLYAERTLDLTPDDWHRHGVVVAASGEVIEIPASNEGRGSTPQAHIDAFADAEVDAFMGRTLDGDDQ